MKLYYSPGACSLSPHIVAREGALPVDLSKVTFSGVVRTTAEGEDFFAVNPKGGYVPTLRLDDDSVMTEGPAIIQYLADQAPQAHLTPEHGTMDYYRMLEWIAFISTELHKGFGPLFRPDISAADKAPVVERLKKRYAYIETAIAGKKYLLGDTFTIADAYLYTILRWSPRAGIVPVAEYPNLADFMKRMETRTAVQTALREEGLEAFA